jgi:hypothetical protein
LPPGRYSFGVLDSVTGNPSRSTTWLDIGELEVVVTGTDALPASTAPERSSAQRTVESAQEALEAGRREDARRMIRTLVAQDAELAPLLVGPFVEPSTDLAKLALEVTEGAARQRLRGEIVRLAMRSNWTMHDPELALGLLEPGDRDAAGLGNRVRVLLALGRSREACDLWASDEEPTFPDPADAAARLSYARAALASLRPDTAERLLRPLLEVRGSLRAEIEALVLGVRVSLMRGREEEARARLGRLRDIPGFEEESLLDIPEIELFLRR